MLNFDLNNFPEDQAAGLRRMMAAPRPSTFSFISIGELTDGGYAKSRLMANIAFSLGKSGAKVLIAQGAKYQTDIKRNQEVVPSMMDEISMGLFGNADSYNINDCVIQDKKNEFSYSRLFSKGKDALNYSKQEIILLNAMLKKISDEYEIVLTDLSFSAGKIPQLPFLTDDNVVIHINHKKDSIQDAYALIKSMSNQMIVDRFSVLITETNSKSSLDSFNQLADVARRFMGLELDYFGFIPEDENINIAANSGKSVIEAFPSSSSSLSFKEIAMRLMSFGRDFSSKDNQSVNFA